MPIFDIILAIILAGFIFFGLFFGFIHTLGSLIGAFAGAFIASRLFQPLGDWLSGIFGYPNWMKIIAFIFIFFLVDRLVGLIFHLADKVFKFISIVPFLKSINRLLGAVLGFFEGILFVGLTMYVVVRFPLGGWFDTAVNNSKFLPWFMKTATILKPLLPDALKQLKEILM